MKMHEQKMFEKNVAKIFGDNYFQGGKFEINDDIKQDDSVDVEIYTDDERILLQIIEVASNKKSFFCRKIRNKDDLKKIKFLDVQIVKEVKNAIEKKIQKYPSAEREKITLLLYIESGMRVFNEIERNRSSIAEKVKGVIKENKKRSFKNIWALSASLQRGNKLIRLWPL